MATRRIARGRGASPVPIIILSVLCVGLIGTVVVLIMKVGDLGVEIEQRDANIGKLDKSLQGEVANLIEYRKLVTTGTRKALKDELDDLKQKIATTQLPPRFAGEEEGAPKEFHDLLTLLDGYSRRCIALKSVVDKLEKELEKAKQDRATADQEAAQKLSAKDDEIKQEKSTSGKLREDKGKLEADFATFRKEREAEIESLKAERTKLVKQVNDFTKDVKDRDLKIKKQAERIVELENPKKVSPDWKLTLREPADGKILTVDPDGKYVMVDMGRRDWVEPSMVFSVFDNTDPENRREKGQIQIRTVHDEISRAKVVKPDKAGEDPLLPGMIAVQPAFKRGRKLEFVLVGKFTEPRLEQMLLRYPCTVAKDVSRTTDYAVLGDAKPEAGETPVEEDEKALRAREWKITVLRESEVLHYLGERD